MGFLKKQPVLSNIGTEEQLQQYVSIAFSEIYEELNGNLEFASNIMADGPYGVTFPDSSTVVRVPHNLGAIPQGILEIKKNAAAIPYAPLGASYAWTSTNIYLQASAQSVVTLYII